jgi:hypothetical protein
MPSHTQNPRRRHSRRSELGYLLAVTVPPLLLGLLFVLGGIRENAAQKQYELEVARVREAGQPIDAHSSVVAFDQRLSTKNSIAWKDVLTATEELNRRFAPAMVDVDELTGTIAPGQPWQSEPIVQRYTEQAQPILRALDELVKDDRAVWEPLVLEGYSTLLPNLQVSRNVARLLVAEFRHAVHQDDHDRALHALQLILGVGQAFDWQVGLISDFIFMTYQATHRELIRQSLEVGFWQTEEQLDRIQEQLAEGDDLDDRWRQSIAGELAMLMAELRVDRVNPEFADPPLNLLPFGIPAETKAMLVSTMVAASEIGGAGTLSHVRANERQIGIGENLTPETSTTTINGFPFAFSDAPLGLLGQTQNYVSAARVFATYAMERRWTVTAVALQQFRLKERRWPKDLGELKSVGLSRSDWLARGDQPFGYRVQGDPPEAILWTSRPGQLTASDGFISPDPPSETKGDPEKIREMEVRLR